jgi:hypothetical protein
MTGQGTKGSGGNAASSACVLIYRGRAHLPLGMPGWMQDPFLGQYLKSSDFEAHNGRGEASFTPVLEMAMSFPSPSAAFDYWNTRSRTNPTRQDGQPNRPLTAWHMEIALLELERQRRDR